MDADRWRQITELFEAVVKRPSGERTTYLEEACAADPELRREVEDLLAADADAAGFLAAPAAAQFSPVSPLDVTAPLPERGGGGEKLPPRIGKYEILGRAGQGGFGEVFRGRDPVLKRLVAIKTCTSDDAALKRRFLREAEIAGRLDHPNVTTVYDSGFHGEVPYLVQEYLPGEDLEETIRERRPTPPAVRLEQLVQIARGLEYAHAQGVVHRDVKPANLRLLDDGRVKIMDFGIAKLASAHTRLTRTGAAMGTVAYMAPEQLRGEGVDGRADVFSFGVVAYELLTCRRPFPGESNAVVLYQILEQDPEPLERRWPACPPPLAALVARCLEKDAADRYPGFTDLLAQLEAIDLRQMDSIELTPEADADAVTLSQRKRRRWKSRRGAHRWLAAAAVLGTLGLGSWLYVNRDDPAAPVSSPPPRAGVPPGGVPPGGVPLVGRLAIDARPWAEVVRIVDAQGGEHQGGDSRFTPLAVALPPGEYTVFLEHPGTAEARRCRVRVRPGATVHCREEFARPDAREFFARSGG